MFNVDWWIFNVQSSFRLKHIQRAIWITAMYFTQKLNLILRDYSTENFYFFSTYVRLLLGISILEIWIVFKSNRHLSLKLTRLILNQRPLEFKIRILLLLVIAENICWWGFKTIYVALEPSWWSRCSKPVSSLTNRRRRSPLPWQPNRFSFLNWYLLLLRQA